VVKTEFPVSEKIYAQLLRAFPKSHREKYGSAMAQLFRDQCRDAWDEAGNFGLLKLWLRALPDLVGNSIRERLAALNERKTMNDKLANLSAYQNFSAGKTFARVFVPVLLIVVIVTTAVTFILPETYVSETRILVENDAFDHIKNPKAWESIRDEIEIIKSPTVLYPVIEQLKLNEVWGKKYNAGEELKTVETYEILKNRIVISLPRTKIAEKKIDGVTTPVWNEQLIAVASFSEDRLEAAQIANAIAQSYRNIERAKSSATLKSKQLTSSVQIVDQAEPPLHPIKPNKPRNIALGVVGGIFLAAIFGGLVVLAKIISRRRPNPPVAS
jgi:uncharacterized protein involved in exopolysaccharide biosynthesis